MSVVILLSAIDIFYQVGIFEVRKVLYDLRQDTAVKLTHYTWQCDRVISHMRA